MVGGTKLPSRNICKIPWLCRANIFDRFQDFGCSRVDGFLPNGPSQKLKKHRVRVFEAKKQFLLYAAWGFATDREGGPCWMLVDTKEQKRVPPLLQSLFPCKFCKIFFLYRMVALSRGCKSPCQHIYVWDLSLYAKLRHPLDFWLTD